MIRAGLISGLILLSVLLIGCFSRGGSPNVATSPEAVQVDAESLWDPAAAEDQVLAYRLRLATEPDNPALHNNLGNLYVLRNWMDEAEASYRRAIRLNPGSPIIWNNLGTAQMKMGEMGQAMSSFRKAIKLDPQYALGWYNIGVIHDAQQHYDQAIDHYLKAISLNPRLLDPAVNPQVVNNDHLMALRLRRYLEEEGGLALPLEKMPD